MIVRIALITSLLALAGCSESPQTLGGQKSDVPAFQGTGSNFTDPGWKAGDKTSWEQHLKTRGSQGQNDYAKGN